MIALLFNLPEFEFAFIGGGTFEMGDKIGDLSQASLPVHYVKVGSMYMGKYQVTQEVWELVMGNNPARFKGSKRPVEEVSWHDVQDFIKKLNKETGKKFRLPTESEWEYAARGGSYRQDYRYAGSDRLKQVGWYEKNSDNQTQEVGKLMANELGLYDMIGNVWEWCEDDWHNNYNRGPIDGSAWIDGPKRGAYRVLRGGSYFNYAVFCRSTNRYWNEPDGRSDALGFRLVLPLQSVG